MKDGKLVVRGDRATQERARNAITRWTQDARRQIHVQLELVPTSSQQIAALPPELARKIRDAVRGGNGVFPSVWSVSETDLLRGPEPLVGRPVEGDTDDRATLSATAFQGRYASGLKVRQEAYVGDAQVKREGGKATVEPVIDVLNTGVSFEARPSAATDPGSIRLEMVVTTGDVRHPIATMAIPEVEGIKTAEGFHIAVPEVRLSQTFVCSDVAVGRWIPVAAFGGGYRFPAKVEKGGEAGVPNPELTVVFVKLDAIDGQRIEEGARGDLPGKK